METTLLTAGLACLIAPIIGGGLKAFSIEIPVLTTWPRQIALFTLGLVLCLIAFAVRPLPPGTLGPIDDQPDTHGQSLGEELGMHSSLSIRWQGRS